MIIDMSKLSERILTLRGKGKSYKEIAAKLQCAVSTISYHCKKSGIGDSEGKYRPPTSEEKLEFQRLYDDGRTLEQVSEIVGWHKHAIAKYIDVRKVVAMSLVERKKRGVVHVANRRRKVKAMAVAHMGGKCVKCGYNKCIAALEFHHLDPAQKDFNLARKGYTFSWDRVREEVEKCILVCANCHREIHHELKYGNLIAPLP